LRNFILAVAIGLAATPSAIFAFFYYAFYWVWRDCFNEEGRCYDSATATVFHEQSGVAYLSLFAASLLLPLFVAVVGFHLTRKPEAKQRAEN
jgi:hypothetical protein